MKNTANTHIVRHAGRYLALMEAGKPTEVTRELDTSASTTSTARSQGPMTAHPKWDPVTGELLFFGYSPLPPYLRYHVADASGRPRTRPSTIDLPDAGDDARLRRDRPSTSCSSTCLPSSTSRAMMSGRRADPLGAGLPAPASVCCHATVGNDDVDVVRARSVLRVPLPQRLDESGDTAPCRGRRLPRRRLPITFGDDVLDRPVAAAAAPLDDRPRHR